MADGELGFQRRSERLDSAVLALIVLVSALPYLFGLGFYSDDWYLLSIFDGAQSGGVLRTIDLATTQTFAARPGHGLYAALLFTLFGLDPTGYHLFNTGVIAAAVLALHALLLRTGFDRFNALAVAIVLALLPQLSTVRVWYSSFQVPLAMLFGVGSLHCALCFVRSGRKLWMLPAALAAWASIACYEIFAPLIFIAAVAPVALTLDRWKLRLNPQWRRSAPLLLLAAAVIVAMVWKAAISTRTAGAGDPMRYLRIAYGIVRFDYDWRVDNGLNLYAALSVNFWHSVVGWFDAARTLLAGRLGPAPTAAAFCIGALSFWRLSTASNANDRPSTPAMLLLGIIIFAAGYAVFLLLPAIVFSPTGLGNRVSVASAIGIAMILVAVIGHGARLLPPQRGRQAAVFALCLLPALAAAQIAQIGSYWVDASERQHAVLAAARADLAGVPAGATVILDNVCSYYGPGVVFETHWDTGFALGFALQRPLKGDIVTERMRPGASGLETSIYGVPSLYPYGRDLFVYDPVRRKTTRLHDRQAASAYFARRAAFIRSCPRGFVAHGVLI